MKTDKELKQLAKEVFDGTVYMAIDEYKLMISFPLFITCGNLPEDTVALYEDYSKAGPRSINGLPFFMSCRYLIKDEFEVFKEYYEQYKEIMQDWVVKEDEN